MGQGARRRAGRREEAGEEGRRVRSARAGQPRGHEGSTSNVLREKWGDEEDENGDALGLAFDHTEGAKAKTKTATAGKKRPRK